MRAEKGDGGQMPSSDYNLWRICREIDAPDDEAARLLDLAAFADGTLDEDDRDRVAAWIDGKAEIMGDIAAARALTAAAVGTAPAAIVERAGAAYSEGFPGTAEIVAFPPFRARADRPAANWRNVAHWGSLAAAVLVAGWLGFNLGIETWNDYNQINQTNQITDDQLHELLDPSAGFMRDLTDAART